jgi:hypothetical protein
LANVTFKALVDKFTEILADKKSDLIFFLEITTGDLPETLRILVISQCIKFRIYWLHVSSVLKFFSKIPLQI